MVVMAEGHLSREPAERVTGMEMDEISLESKCSWEDLREQSEFLKSLADPVRLKILKLLLRGELCVCELASVFHISQPTLSYHLRILEREGILRSRREGKSRYYSIRNEEVAGIVSRIMELLEAWIERTRLK